MSPSSHTRTVPSIGVHLPPQPGERTSYREMAHIAEQVGFDALWVSDHTVLISGSDSKYPFSRDGRFFQPANVDWFDWLVTLSYLAAVTTRIRLGVAVVILPLRHPLSLAKQLSSLDQLSGGRVTVGVGIGWLAEEFDALGVPFSTRGALTDAGLALLRAAWSGEPKPGDYGPYTLGPGVRVCPRPRQDRVPILIGGDGKFARERMARFGDGWAAAAAGGRPDPGWISVTAADLRARYVRGGRDPAELMIDVRVAAPAQQAGKRTYASYLAELVAAGATSLSFDVSWRDPDRVHRTLSTLRNVTEEVMT